MEQAPRGTRLALEETQHPLVGGDLRTQDLDGDLPVHGRLGGQINLAEPAAGQEGLNDETALFEAGSGFEGGQG